jgi:hypothetical protein
MSKKSKTRPHAKDHHGNNHHAAEHDPAKEKTLIHHDWRFWTAIVLMLLAISAYVLSFDESLLPGEVDEPVVPMVAE